MNEEKKVSLIYLFDLNELSQFLRCDGRRKMQQEQQKIYN